MTGAARATVEKLLRDLGHVCAMYQDVAMRNLPCTKIQVDEIWGFVYAKQKNVAKAKAAPEHAGDTWTWVAIDADTKLVPCWLVGGRDAGYATEFMQDLAGRLASRVQLTSDGLRVYLSAVEDAFGADIDYAMLVKHYGNAPEGQRRYSPAVCTGATKVSVSGNPDDAQCTFHGRVGSGNIVRHGFYRTRSGRRRRYRCVRCAKTFSSTKGTPTRRGHGTDS